MESFQREMAFDFTVRTVMPAAPSLQKTDH